MYKFLSSVLASILTLVTLIFSQNPGTSTPEFPLANINPNPVAEAVTAQDITVMTFNVKINGDGRKSVETRMPVVADIILDHKPDSVGVQEADKGWTDGLSKLLTDYDRVGKFRDDGILKGESSSIFYLKDKYELVESGDFWLSKTPDVPSKDWEAGHYRILTYAILKNKETGFIYAHFNTHFDNASSQARTESVAIVSQKVAEIAPDIPIVFTGDLNFSEGCTDYNNLISCGFKDTKHLATEYDDCATYHDYIPFPFSAKPIDYILTNAYVDSVDSYFIDTRCPDFIYPSDHFPIIVKMTLFNGGTR